MPQFESVEDIRRVKVGQTATLIPSWNTGFPLRAEPVDDAAEVGLVRPGQRLQVLEEQGNMLKVRQEAEDLVGWIAGHVVTAWPD
ncbi:MAG: SH3 domain-containing protein [Candidatus Dormibacteria bacterium]